MDSANRGMLLCLGLPSRLVIKKSVKVRLRALSLTEALALPYHGRKSNRSLTLYEINYMTTFRPSLIENHTSKTSTLPILDREEICEIPVIKNKRCKRFYPPKTYPETTRKGITLDKLCKLTKKN